VSLGLFDLGGKTALVTGGNGGLGLAYARGLAKHGCDAVLWGRNQAKNAAAVAELEALGVKAFAQVIDVSDEQQVIAGFAEAVDRVGRLDIVIQNAGFSNPAPSFVEMTTEAYRAQMAVAMDGGFYTLREAARHMKERVEAGDPPGSIILCGSGSVFQGIHGMEHYGAAKAGLAAMMKGMATELAPLGIRVNMIAPGYIDTELGGTAEVKAFMASRTPMLRLGNPEDVEAAAVYLASDAARYHTGDILVIDGGWLASYM
jgi:NAD(P)-dependent dehydrogenase (short-subunit alcohol dehydrogenase family)